MPVAWNKPYNIKFSWPALDQIKNRKMHNQMHNPQLWSFWAAETKFFPTKYLRLAAGVQPVPAPWQCNSGITEIYRVYKVE